MTIRPMKSRSIGVIALGTALTATTLSTAAVPDYEDFELLIRSNFSDAFRLPDSTFFTNGTPSINDDRLVAMRLSIIGGDAVQGVWVGDIDEGEIGYETPIDVFVSDASLNNNGFVVFEQFFSAADGLYFYDWTTSDSGLETTQPLGASGWESPTVNDSGESGYRVDFGFTGQGFVSYDGVDSTAIHVVEASVDPQSPYSFLFTPTMNDARQIAGKARLGEPGQFGEDQPDQIRLFNADESSVLIAEDADSDGASPYASFDNSVAVTDDGRVAFIATLNNGDRGVFLSDGTTTVEIATEADPEISEIEFFRPAVNNDGLVAFRAFDDAGLRAIFVGDGETLAVAIREHDLLDIDLGIARIDQNDNSPVFGGAPDLNDNGDLAFQCALTPEDDNQIEWGSGVFVAVAGGAIPGDLDGDGDVDVDDLLALLGDWGQSGSDADLDGNGTVDVDDLLILLGNWG